MKSRCTGRGTRGLAARGLVAMLFILSMVGCSMLDSLTQVRRPTAAEVDGPRHPPAAPAPLVLNEPADALLRWVGLQIARTESRVAVFGASCDGTKGAAVDLQAACLSALITVRSRTPATFKVSGALSGSTYGPVSPVNPSPVPLAMHVQPNVRVQSTSVLLPDVELHGWATGQQTGTTDSTELGIAGTGAELGKSRSIAFQATDFAFTLRQRVTSTFVARVLQVRAVAWDASAGIEAGVFVSASLNGKARGVGVRAQRAKTETVNSVDLHRTVAMIAAASLLAEHYGIDASECPCLRPGKAQGSAKESPELTALRVATPATLHKAAEMQRIGMAVRGLHALGYLNESAVDIEALRVAMKRFRAERGMALVAAAPAGIDDLLALQKALLELGEPDPSERDVPRHGGVMLTAEQGITDLTLRDELIAYAVVPREGGHLTCAYRSDALGEWLLISPTSATDPGDTITAQSAVTLPRDKGSGPEVRLTVDEKGTHRIWCALSRVSLARKLPRHMTSPPKPFKMGENEFPSLAARLLGDAWVTDGLLVVTAKAPPPQKPAPVATKPHAATGCRCEPERNGGVSCYAVPAGSRISPNSCPTMVVMPQPATPQSRKSVDPR